jgi:ribonuclease-3
LLTSGEWSEARLGYRFGDPALLDAALTHRSAGKQNYERLEFLGDAVLNFAVAGLVFQAYPEADEGDLSRYRAALVSGQSLAEAAVGLGLGDQLRLGSGELKTGGFRRSSILSGGLEAARAVIEAVFSDRVAALPEARDLKDPKTRLQEWLQGRGERLPAYAVDEMSGEPHEHWFVASCEVAGFGLRELGEGSSRRRAEQSAAQRVLDALANREESK